MALVYTITMAVVVYAITMHHCRLRGGKNERETEQERETERKRGRRE